jgi:hypothetical protein
MAALDRLETAVRADRPDLARTWLGELEAFAAGTGATSAVAVVEHGRALLAADTGGPSAPRSSCAPPARPRAAETSPPPPS